MIGSLGLEEIAGYTKRQIAIRRVLRGHGQVVAPVVRRPWVARIIGRHPLYKLDREFLDAKRDYSEATRSGKRGVRLWFVLDSGSYYEVMEWSSARVSRRYFVKVVNGYVLEVDSAEVERWLDEHETTVAVSSSGASESTS